MSASGPRPCRAVESAAVVSSWRLLPVRRRFLCLFILPALSPPPASQGDQDDEAKIFKRFVEEFVELTPGKGKFPASFVMGSADADLPASEKPAVTVTFKYNFAMAK